MTKLFIFLYFSFIPFKSFASNKDYTCVFVRDFGYGEEISKEERCGFNENKLCFNTIKIELNDKLTKHNLMLETYHLETEEFKYLKAKKTTLRITDSMLYISNLKSSAEIKIEFKTNAPISYNKFLASLKLANESMNYNSIFQLSCEFTEQ